MIQTTITPIAIIIATDGADTLLIFLEATCHI
jgi:hypothetical protein